MIIAPSHSHTNTAKLAKTIQHKVCASFAIFWFQDMYLYKTLFLPTAWKTRNVISQCSWYHTTHLPRSNCRITIYWNAMSGDNSDRTVTDYKERCHLYDYSLQTTEKIKNGSQRNIIFEVFFLLLKNYSIMAKIQLICPF